MSVPAADSQPAQSGNRGSRHDPPSSFVPMDRVHGPDWPISTNDLLRQFGIHASNC